MVASWYFVYVISFLLVVDRASAACSSSYVYLTASTTSRLTLSSPNYPSNYDNNENCRWRIDAGSGNYVVLEFTNFVLETGYDYAYFYDGGSTSSTLLGTYTGSTLPSNIRSTNRYLTILFRSDSSVQRRGFQAEYYGVDSSGSTASAQNLITTPATTSSCLSELSLSASNSATGYITSLNYPSNYENNLNCRYLITSSVSGYTSVEIEIIDLDLETCCDRLNIYDGSSTSYQSLASSLSTGQTLKSSGSSVYITFTTDGSVVNRGFSISYKAIQEEIPSCGLAYTAYYATTSTQTITSPNYPYHYNSNSITHWLIVKPDSDDKLVWYFESFRLEFDYSCDDTDYLIAYNGACDTSTVIDRYCGYEDDDKHYHSYGKYVLFKMVTDSSQQYRGFSMKYSIIDADDDEGSATAKGGVIAGATIGVVIPLVIVAIICFKFSRKKTRVTTTTQPKQKPPEIAKPRNFVIHMETKPPKPKTHINKKYKTTEPPAQQISILPQPQPPPNYPPPYASHSDPAYPPIAPTTNPTAPPAGTYMGGGGMSMPNYAASYPPPRNPSIPNPFEYKPAYR